MAFSADYIISELKGIKETQDNGSKYAIEQYLQLPIWSMDTTAEWDERFNSTEGMTGSRKLSELEEPDVLKLNEGYSVVLTNERFGGAIEVSEQARVQMKDSTTAVDKFLETERNRVMHDNKYLFAENIHKFFNEAFDSTSELLAPDGVELCGTHSWNTDGSSTWDNSTSSAFSETAIDAALDYGGAFTSADGKVMPQSFDTIVVKKNSAVAREARKLFAEHIAPTKVDDINIYEGQMTIIELPLITEANKGYWFLFDLKQHMSPLYVGITEFPTMREPQLQKNEAVRSNVTGFYKTGIKNMPFNVYGGGNA